MSGLTYDTKSGHFRYFYFNTFCKKIRFTLHVGFVTPATRLVITFFIVLIIG